MGLANVKAQQEGVMQSFENKFHPEHLWVRLLPGGEALVGISNFAREQLGEVVYVDYPRAGSDLVQGVSFGVVESSKIVSDLIAPVSGTVLEANPEGAKAIVDINADPEGQGWILRIRVTGHAELDSLLTSAQYLSRLGVH
jgi:glycine cleavage system H protein